MRPKLTKKDTKWEKQTQNQTLADLKRHKMSQNDQQWELNWPNTNQNETHIDQNNIK